MVKYTEQSLKVFFNLLISDGGGGEGRGREGDGERERGREGEGEMERERDQTIVPPIHAFTD